MSHKTRNRLLVEGILQHEAESRHSAMFSPTPEPGASANEALWEAFDSKECMVDSEEEMESANTEMVGLIRAHREACGDYEDDNCSRLWRLLG